LNAFTGAGWPVYPGNTGRAPATGSPAKAGALDDAVGFVAALAGPQHFDFRDFRSDMAALHSSNNCNNLLDFQEIT